MLPMDSITLVFRPLTNEEIPMTTTTPMTIPNTVSADRSLVAAQGIDRHLHENFRRNHAVVKHEELSDLAIG